MKQFRAYRHYVVIGFFAISAMILAQYSEHVVWANISELQTVPSPTPTAVEGEALPAKTNDDDQEKQAITARTEDKGIQVNGLLIDEETRDILGGLKIQLGEQEIEADDNGIFRFGDNAPGLYMLTVLSNEGEILVEQMLEVTEAGVDDLLIEVNPDQPRRLNSTEPDITATHTPSVTTSDNTPPTDNQQTSSPASPPEQPQSRSLVSTFLIIGGVLVVIFGTIFMRHRRNVSLGPLEG